MVSISIIPNENYFTTFLLFLGVFGLVISNYATANPGPDWHKKRIETSTNWLNHGGDIYNRRYAEAETKISPSTASKLRLKWKFYAGGDITATPAMYNGTVYFPSWNGNLYAVKADDGSLVWQKNIKELTGINATVVLQNVTTTVARATPTIATHDLLIIGIYGPAFAIAVKRATGELVWSTQLDPHPFAVVAMSGTYHDGGFYVGTSSREEGVDVENCCTFRGSLAKLDAQTGAILWKTFMLPENHGKIGGYAGAAIWGSSPSIDVKRNLVYIATGNLYSVPPRIRKCQEEQNNQTIPTDPDKCIEPESHSESILALDMDSGKIKWYRQLGGYDVFIADCVNSSNPNCPPGPSPDADFGEAPMLLNTRTTNGTKQDIVVAVQKSGIAWALNSDDGKTIWSTVAGPGGIGGGGTWGAATDNNRVYTNIVNSNQLNFTLLPSKEVITSGGWVTMDARTGRILWSTAVPNNGASNPMTLANGVLFAGSLYPTGPVYAISAKTGKILWSYETGATVYGGMSVSKGCIYVGHGYKVNEGASIPFFTAGTYLFAFCVE